MSDVWRCRIVLLGEAGELSLLDMRIIIDEGAPETGAERLVSPERRACLTKRLRQRRRLHLVRCVRGRSRVDFSRNAVEPGMDLRGDVEIRIGRRLPDAVLQMRHRIARLSHDA